MTRLSFRLTLLALSVWAACFWLLERTGAWFHFAIAGWALSLAVLASGAVPRALLRPTPRALTAGALSGGVMVLVTQAGYRAVAGFVPSLVPSTAALLSLLDVVGVSTSARTLLIVTIAASEELIFRGLLPTSGDFTRPALPTRRELLVSSALSVLYALTTAPLGSGLLIGCALVCGLIWSLLRRLSGSLLVPILAHVIWDLGVLLLWPLPTQG